MADKVIDDYQMFGDNVSQAFPLINPDLKNQEERETEHKTWFQNRIRKPESLFEQAKKKRWWLNPDIP